MATGTVSSITSDNWQLIQTNTTSSGTSSTISFSGYKRLLLVWDGISTGTAGYLYLQFNSSSAGYVGGAWLPGNNGYQSDSTVAYIDPYSTTGDRSGYLYVENTATSAPKTYQGWGNDDSFPFMFNGAWINSSAVTSITITPGGRTFNGGSISLYGIAA